MPRRPRFVMRPGMARFYWFHFQPPGRAEAEFERDPEATFRRRFSIGARVAAATEAAALDIPADGGFLDRLPDPGAPPPWVDAETFATFVATYRRTGFQGGLNWYRNIDRNWELTAPGTGRNSTSPPSSSPATATASSPGRWARGPWRRCRTTRRGSPDPCSSKAPDTGCNRNARRR